MDGTKLRHIVLFGWRNGTTEAEIEEIAGEGAILVGPGGVRAANDDAGADVTLTADLATFRAIFEGALSPTAAFMTGRLKVEGDMATALRLAGALA